MAKLSARGRKCVGEIVGGTWTKRYMSDGVVLKNSGHGWNVHARVKAGHTPEGAFEVAKAKQEAFLSVRPAATAYRSALIRATGLSKRWKLHAAISLMPDDADGVWSEVSDGYGDNCHLDVEEILELCNKYKAALAEYDAMSAAKEKFVLAGTTSFPHSGE